MLIVLRCSPGFTFLSKFQESLFGSEYVFICFRPTIPFSNDDKNSFFGNKVSSASSRKTASCKVSSDLTNPPGRAQYPKSGLAFPFRLPLLCTASLY